MKSRIIPVVLTKVTAQALPVLLVLLSPFATFGQPVECPDHCLPGRYSVQAAQVDFGREGYSASHPIYAPDRQKALRIDDDRLWLEIGEKRIATPPDPHDWSWVEIGWAPDSQTFFISHSVGYTTGYRVELFRLQGDTVVALADVNRAVQRDFERRHKCYDTAYKTGNNPNIAGLAWMDDAHELLVIAEVPNVGICKQMGYFAGYLVSADSGGIIQRYTPQKLAQHWGKQLGENLLSDLHYMSRSRKTIEP